MLMINQLCEYGGRREQARGQVSGGLNRIPLWDVFCCFTSRRPWPCLKRCLSSCIGLVIQHRDHTKPLVQPEFHHMNAPEMGFGNLGCLSALARPIPVPIGWLCQTYLETAPCLKCGVISRSGIDRSSAVYANAEIWSSEYQNLYQNFGEVAEYTF